MKLKHLTLLFFVTVALLLMASTVQAAIWVEINPPKIPPNEKVTITVTATAGDNVIDKIVVTDPDGATYTKDYDPNPLLKEGESLSEDFGTGITGWSPDADTSTEGWYSVVVWGYSPREVKMENRFDVSRYFFVPEFAFPSVILTALFFALLNVEYRIRKKWSCHKTNRSDSLSIPFKQH